jgi:RND family efflux transporter MFP subunit
MSQPLWKKIPLPVVIISVGAVLIAGLLTLKPKPQAVVETMPPPPEVAVVLAEPRTQTLSVKTQGTVTPKREITLVTQVAGSVVQVDDEFVNGGFFKEGQALIQVDDRDHQLSLIRAKARVAEAAQLLATEKGRAYQAKREWRDLGNAEANDLFLRKPQLAAAKANLEAAKADQKKADLDIERAQISVPFTGRIRETFVNLGQYLSPGSKVATVYDTSVAEIRLALTDRQAALIDMPFGFRGAHEGAETGAPVTISGMIAGERYSWIGRVARTDASIDTSSRFYYVVAEVVDPFVVDPASVQVPLVVGLFVDAQISGRPIDNVITLPREALFKRDWVYTLSAENKIQAKQINLLHINEKQAWVKGDIAPGEAVVVARQGYLGEGLVVKPKPVSSLVAGG